LEGTTIFNLWVDGCNYDIRAILFDKDGTLIDLETMWGSWLTIANRVLNRLIAEEFPSIPRKGFTLMKDTFDKECPLAVASTNELYTILTWQMYQLGIDWVNAKNLVRKSESIINNEMYLLKPVKPTKGLVDFLNVCNKVEVPLAIVTSDNKVSARRHMQWIGILPYFSTIIGSTSVRRGKPYPDMIELACSRLGVFPNEVALVGDTVMDMQLAQESGIKLTIGFNNPNLDASHIISDYREMKIKQIA
jgi:haloacid dehalogenase superfamily, subfamily IA, variant 1 with third motif having Dx(3-4)D or Dx(3-4)E